MQDTQTFNRCMGMSAVMTGSQTHVCMGMEAEMLVYVDECWCRHNREWG